MRATGHVEKLDAYHTEFFRIGVNSKMHKHKDASHTMLRPWIVAFSIVSPMADCRME
jgi:hypothetical protein